MNWSERLAAAFGMKEAAWVQQANPWGFWTRVAAFPLLVLAIWSRVWLGWGAVLPIGWMAFWLWYNPRAFAPPVSTDNWASKAVLGERVWLGRDTHPIPAHHAWMALALAGLSMSGVVFLAWGLYAVEIWPVLCGTILVFFGKLWFADRMVWLYEDMKDSTPEYRSWLY